MKKNGPVNVLLGLLDQDDFHYGRRLTLHILDKHSFALPRDHSCKHRGGARCLFLNGLMEHTKLGMVQRCACGLPGQGLGNS